MITGDVTRIEIEKVSNGWQAKIWRSSKPHLIELIAHTFGEINDLVFSHVAEKETKTGDL
ncbi:MAG: hypothetical protein ACR2RF_24840 [Geminicoccaceae bacterium]